MGNIVFCHGVTLVPAYVALVTRVKQMFKLTFKFTLTFMSRFLLEVITLVALMLGSWNLVTLTFDCA